MAKYNYTGDPRFRPLSAWAYFGYSLLFSIPLVGLILLIVFSFDDDRIVRRNFARSYFCGLILVAVLVGLGILTGGATALLGLLQSGL